MPEHLQIIKLPTISNRQCKKIMRGVTRGEICTQKGHLESACGVSIGLIGLPEFRIYVEFMYNFAT